MHKVVWIIGGLTLILAVGVLVLNWYLHRRHQFRIVEKALNNEAVLLEAADILDNAYDDFMDQGALGFDEEEPMPSHENVTEEDWFPFGEDR